ncbi:MAG: N-acetyl-gamma-glutamyl-phosphate reductase [Clostridiales bacterium]|nr:N-acetyl-gamma-glutamyl-phosphate reductase [Clostridiales bacterium]MDD7387181.1 N-acetyl-gamma-glutamyl-phosphate reductase [Bacillota bacterium]MDY6040882.1 N-acetyl-gamma-glutamyl-phosphate reductase [Candidatus Faecousia sp.]
MMTNVFIDGSAGTTGLRIAERLAARRDLNLIRLPEALRKNPAARKEAINSADIVFLCLPDDAAREAVALVSNPRVKIIDTSTAHRTAPGWVYGFPELAGQREKLAAATRIANPGCHASGFVALVAPLVQQGILEPGALLSCFSLTGYSGGGKKMIAAYEDSARSALLDAPRQYGLTQQHKHLKEMKALCALENEPVFCPIVGDFYSGMEVTVPLFARQVNGTADDIRDVYRTYYTDGLVRFTETPDSDGLLSAAALAGRDDMEISVFGNDTRILLTARFDNLGKGASGAAIQNLNILLGIDQAMGLNV